MIVKLLHVGTERVVLLPEQILSRIGVEKGATQLHLDVEDEAIVLRAALRSRSGWTDAAARIGMAGTNESSGCGE